MTSEVTVVFDIGKTNKKFILYNHKLKELQHKYVKFAETVDEDGYPCEDIDELINWVQSSLKQLIANGINVKNVNFSTYGASLVHLDEEGERVTPVYNYLKPYPEFLLASFFSKYGNQSQFSVETCSPIMGFLNSGLQLYYLKHCKNDLFKKIKYTLHLPQYLSYVFTGEKTSGFPSVGCHTGLWNFEKHAYHEWLKKEDLTHLVTAPVSLKTSFESVYEGNIIRFGIGVHDSSASLIPLLKSQQEPFILLSTGTWNICMNPFNTHPVKSNELEKDCLNFLGMDGQPIKASRLFLGQYLHERTQIISEHFHVDFQSYKRMKWKDSFKPKRDNKWQLLFNHELLRPERFGFFNNPKPNYDQFENFGEAYLNLMDEITDLQIESLKLIVGKTGVRTIYIDGGFLSNEIFIKMLKDKLPKFIIKICDQTTGSALGAAMLVN